MKMDKTAHEVLKMQIEDRKIIIHSAVKSGFEFDFADAIEKMIVEDETKDIIIDLTKTPFINSSALSIMLNCKRHMKKKGAQLKLIIKELSAVAHLIEITNLNQAFEIEWIEK
jgi:anti-anti-sigma factor